MPSESGPSPDSPGTTGGGELHRPAPPPHPPAPPVTNQQQLVLPPDLTTDLPPDQVHAVKVAQIEFARDVSHASAKAYKRVLEVLAGHTHRIE